MVKGRRFDNDVQNGCEEGRGEGRGSVQGTPELGERIRRVRTRVQRDGGVVEVGGDDVRDK